jgi:hypothetical protein
MPLVGCPAAARGGNAGLSTHNGARFLTGVSVTHNPNKQDNINGDKSATSRLRPIGHALATHVVKPNPSCMVAELEHPILCVFFFPLVAFVTPTMFVRPRATNEAVLFLSTAGT